MAKNVSRYLAGFMFKVAINGNDSMGFTDVQFGASGDSVDIGLTRGLVADEDGLYKMMRRQESVEISVQPLGIDHEPVGLEIVVRTAKPVSYHVDGLCATDVQVMTERVHFEFLEFTSKDWDIIFLAKGPRGPGKPQEKK